MAYKYEYTFPTITGSSHTGFKWVMRAADFPTAAIDGGGTSILNGGGNLRVYADSSKAVQYPVDVVTFVTGGSPSIEVWITSPVSTGGTVYIEADSVETAQPFVTDTYGRDAVHPNSVAVLHCQDSSGSLVDSSGNSNVGVPYNSPTYSQTGQIGYGVGTTNSGSNCFEITSTTDFDFSSLSTGYRIKKWLSLTATQTSYAGILSKGGAANDFAIQRSSSSNDMIFYHGVTTATISGGWSTFVNVGMNMLDVVWDKSNIYLYKNGSLVSSAAMTANPTYNSGYKVRLGSARVDPYSVNGVLDEIQIDKEFAPSANWLATEYANQSAAGAWGTVGTWADSGGGGGGSLAVFHNHYVNQGWG